MKILLLVSLIFSAASQNAFAWGGRGHDTVCQAAVFLLKEKGLKDYLEHKPFMMGHLCNIPDFYWKGLGSLESQYGNPAHFIDSEVLGVKVSEIPLDYKKIISDYTGKKNAFTGQAIQNVPKEVGSNWWRADQFYKLALSAGKKAAAATPPRNGVEDQDDNYPYNKSAYNFIINLGLLGHFVADDSQPFHVTADYDGEKANHDGIHAYYEEALVGVQPYTLMDKVIEEAQKMLSDSSLTFLKSANLLENMRALAAVSIEEIPAIYKLDAVDKNPKGRVTRKPAAANAQTFAPLITTELARAAALLAKTWDEAYVQSGRPNLSNYKSYHYPFTVDFVLPDYFPMSKNK